MCPARLECREAPSWKFRAARKHGNVNLAISDTTSEGFPHPGMPKCHRVVSSKKKQACAEALMPVEVGLEGARVPSFFLKGADLCCLSWYVHT